MGAKIGPANVYTQKDLAAMLGVSTRTLRRFKNEPGHRLAPRTLARVKAPLDRENRSFRRYVSGKAYDPKTGTLIKSPKLKLPTLPVQPIPTLYKSKSGLSQTLSIAVDLWSAQQKIDYFISAVKSGRFLSWTARVKVPVGVATSGDVDGEPNEGERAQYYMIGPFTLANDHRAIKKIEKEIAYHEDAGRIVVNLSIVENLPGEK